MREFENLNQLGFCELNENEMMEVDGGEVLDKITDAVVEAAKFIYEVGQDVGEIEYDYVYDPLVTSSFEKARGGND